MTYCRDSGLSTNCDIGEEGLVKSSNELRDLFDVGVKLDSVVWNLSRFWDFSGFFEDMIKYSGNSRNESSFS